jgi:hypothetical protein
VFKAKEIPIVFSASTSAIAEYNGRTMLYNRDLLQAKSENSDKDILYIGKAGGKNNRLRKRIKQYLKYGIKEANNHMGGRAIWQLQNNKELLIKYLECDNPEDKERELLQNYLDAYGVLPVANGKIG